MPIVKNVIELSTTLGSGEYVLDFVDVILQNTKAETICKEVLSNPIIWNSMLDNKMHDLFAYLMIDYTKYIDLNAISEYSEYEMLRNCYKLMETVTEERN